MKTYQFHLILLIFISAVSGICNARDYKVELLDADDGFNASVIFSIIQDQQGFIWFGSGYQGISRFDGKNLLNYRYRKNDKRSISSDHAGNIFLDSNNNLWIGSWGGGAIYFDQNTARFTQYQYDAAQVDTISDEYVQSIFQDSQGDIWFGTFTKGLNKFNPKNQSFTRFDFSLSNTSKPKKTSISSERIWDISQTEPNSIWLGTNYGLNKYNKITHEFSHFIPDPSKGIRSINKIRNILPTQHNSLLLTTDNGVLLFDLATEKFTHLSTNAEFQLDEVFSIIKTSFNEYWVSSSKGIFSFSLNDLTLKKVDLGGVDYCSQTLFEDKDQTIWLSCEGAGVYKINPVKGFQLNNTAEFKSVRSMSLSNDNQLLIAGSSSIFNYHINSGVTTSLNIKGKTLFQSAQGDLWYGNTDGLYKKNKKGPPKKIAPPSNTIHASFFNDFEKISQDNDNNIWLGTAHGLFILNETENKIDYIDKQSSHNGYSKGLTDLAVTEIYKDRQGNMWVATYNGLNFWNRQTKQFKHFYFAGDDHASKPSNFVNDIIQDSKNNIWVGSQEGLLLLNKNTGTFKRYDTSMGLANNAITGIIEDEFSDLWLISTLGVSKFSPETTTFTNYDQRDGLSSSRYYEYSAKAADGTIFFASRDGLHYFNPKYIDKQTHNANTVLTNFEILGSPSAKQYYTSTLAGLDLPYNENYLKFEFATLDFSNARQIQYQYKLAGFDKTWVNSGTNNVTVYTNLDGGNYTFKVRSSYRKNEWYEGQLNIPVKIATPFWLTWWMYAIYTLGSMLAIQYYFVRKSKKQRQELERQKHFVSQLEQQVTEKTASIAFESSKLFKANQIKNQFLANMSHEIRTPMNAVIGFSHMALRNETNPQQADYLQKIQSASESLLLIINDILDISKIEEKKLILESIPFELEALIQKVVSICSYKMGTKPLELMVDIAPGVKTSLMGDPLRLQQVLVNLVDNAIKFTDKGLVYFTVETFSENEDKNQLQFSITDTGIGMTAEQQNKLFKSFTQADDSITRKYGGSGLGLTITKQLIELMKGSIDVKSELGKGSIFTFTAEFIVDQTCKLVSTPLTLPEHLRVLLVDNHQLSKNIVLHALHEINISTIEATTAQQAVEQIEFANKINKPYDLVLIDVNIAEFDSITAVKKRQASLPFILFVPVNQKHSAYQSSIGLNVVDIIEKPIMPCTLRQSITQVLAPTANISSVESKLNEIPQLSDFSVLLVEDNLLNQKVAKAFLADTHINIDCANDGEIALQKMKQYTYDIVLMDVQMPNMDGLTAASVIRHDLKLTELPIIAMTAHAMEGDVDKSKQAGMNEHLTKPISPEKLYQTLVKYLQPLSR